MKKWVPICVALALAVGVQAELVQNYDFTGSTESPWSHAGYVAWSGSWVDLTDNYGRTTGWGDGSSWSNSYFMQDLSATFQANTVYSMTVEWRDPTGQGTAAQLVLYETTGYADVATSLTSIPPANVWVTDTLVFDTASDPTLVGKGIGVAVRNQHTGGGWMDLNYVSLVIASAATDPDPENGTTVDPVVTVQLSWAYPPAGTYTSQVYLGTPNIGSATLLPDADDTDTVVDVSLSAGSNYEWRVDITDSGSGQTITGEVWSFQTVSSPSDSEVTINPDVTHQTFEGFGVGTMDQFIPYWYTVWSSAKRNEYLDSMYTLNNDGLGLEITRVPMPVGDDLSHAHMWAYNNPGQNQRSPEAIETSSGTFVLSGHDDILWHIQGAAARGVKMWAYWHSVPLWLTRSGCTAGYLDGSYNLESGQEARFAEHIADIVEIFSNSWGVDFDFISAINEPDENWWDCWNEDDDIWAGNQPGCNVPASQAVTIYQELHNEMTARGLNQKLIASDSYSANDVDDRAYIDTLRNSSVGPEIDVYSCHQYAVNDYGMAQWYWRTLEDNKSYWMSEWGDWENAGWPDDNPILQAENYADHIQQGLKDMKTTAYIFWESRLMINTTTSDFMPRKAYWIAAQFSRFIRSGMQSVDALDGSANCKTTVWVDPIDDPAGQKLVMVTVNDSSSPKTINYDLSRFRGATINEVRRTSEAEDFADISFTQSSDFDFSVYAPAKSVVTVLATVDRCQDTGAEMTNDCFVDLDDLMVVAQNWLNTQSIPCSPMPGDTNNDCDINLEDMAAVSGQWLGIKAFNPDPTDGQGSVNPQRTLRWGDNVHAVSYDVYIGTDAVAVAAATPASAEYKGNQAENSYVVNINPNQSYYWRLDTEDSLGQFQTGNVWSFTTTSVTFPESLVGWWKLDESNGSTAADASGNGYTGYLAGNPQWKPTQGIIDGAIDLDGNGDYIAISGLSLTSDNVTFTAWINGVRGADWAGIFYSRSAASTGLHFGGSSKLYYTWNYDDNSTWGWNGGPPIPENEWVMVALTVEPDKATLYVYSDTNGFQSGVNNISHVPQTIDTLEIGRDSVDYARTFNGLVDDVRIYNRALTQQEILDLVP